MLTGRFAPSPSGRMHLGNVFSALLAWLSVRSRGGRMLLRIEDLDPDRCRPEYAETLKRDLDWLGLDWDAEQTPQSRRTEAYRAAETIRRCRPKLLLAAYHRSEDLFALPQLVFSIRSDYQLYLRHHRQLPAWDVNFYFV